MKTYVFHLLVFSLVCVLFIGCGTKDQITVGISMGPLHERWLKDRNYLTQHLESKGVEVLMKEAEGNEKQQALQAKELIDDHVDVLIIMPVNSETAGKIVNYAKQEGVKVIAYDRIIKDCDLDFYVSFDNIRVGEIQAEYLTKIKPKGNYVILGGDSKDNNSTLLRIGQMNILQPYVIKGDIKIVIDQNVENWDAEIAYQIINDYLDEGNKLDAIIASNDALSGGVARALEEHGLGREVLTSGQDAETDACRRIVQGKQTMTVYKLIESLASTATNIAIALAKDESIPDSQTTINNGQKMVPAILIPSLIPVARENIRMTVIADGYLDENEVFGKE